MKFKKVGKIMMSMLILASIAIVFWIVTDTFAQIGIPAKEVAMTDGGQPQGLFSFLDQPQTLASTANSATNISTSTTASTGLTPDTSGQMTLDQLSAYNGKNGNPAYIAVNGNIYDVSGLLAWKIGEHHGYSAGNDLTEAFSRSPHSASILNNAELVGVLVDEVIPADSASAQNASSNNTTTVNGTNVTDQTENIQAEQIPADAVSSASQQVTGGDTGTTSPVDQGTNVSNSQNPVTVQAENNQNTSPSSSTANTFNSSSLAGFDGRNGNRAYIAVGGIVYDVTDVGAWSNGSHHGLQAGQDLTAAFAGSPHSQSILDMAVVVGTYSASGSSNVNINNPVSPNPVTTSPLIKEESIDDDDHDYDDDHEYDEDDDHEDDDHEDDDHDDDHEDDD